MSKPYELRVLEYLRDFRGVARRVKEIARTIDPGAKVFVFGSTVRGRYTALSDIDVLVVIEDPGRKYEIMTRVYGEVEAPVELHVVTRELFERWYKRFIDPNELVEV